jgi:hypothetical protein
VFKKILIIILLTLTLFNFGLILQPSVYAVSSGVNDTEFTFSLEDSITPPGMKSNDTSSWLRKGINFFFERGITIMAATVGTAAVLMISVGGFLILSSAGNDTQVTKGKGYITKALIGLAFVLGAYILVTTVQLLIKSIFKT